MTRAPLKAAVLATLLASCGGITDAPPRDTPFVYLLLSPVPIDAGPDSTPWALVATVRSPIEANYRTPVRFRVRRERDASEFVWMARDLAGSLPGSFAGVQLEHGANANVTLSAGGDSGALGWRSLTGGDIYALTTDAGGSRITGRAVIPEKPALQLVERGSAHVVTWQRARGAAGYFVRPSEYASGRFTPDTQFVWCELPGSGPSAPRYLRVVALDSNAYRYLADSAVDRAGVVGALGLFGGAFEERVSPTSPRPTTIDPNCGS